MKRQTEAQSGFYYSEPSSNIDFQSVAIHNTFMVEVEKAMEMRGMTKKELATKVGTSASYITQLFRFDKMVNMEMLAKMKIALDIEFIIHGVVKQGKREDDFKNIVSLPYRLIQPEDSTTLAS